MPRLTPSFHFTKRLTGKCLVADAMVDASLVSMQLMLVARYETNPMAGYDASKAAAEFGLVVGLNPTEITRNNRND